MIVEIFEQKHRSEHKKKCPRTDKFYHLHENIEYDKEIKRSLRRSRREESRSCNITLDDD